MNLSYRQKLFLYFGILFCLFAVGIAGFDQFREKANNILILEERLEAYTDILHEKLQQNTGEIPEEAEQFQKFFPKELRISVININGIVEYDNSFDDLSVFDNHLQRAEIQLAAIKDKGAEIRVSDTNQQEYLYFAKAYENYYIRAALPYTQQIRQFLKPDNGFLYFILVFFALFLFLIHFITKRFATSIRQLRDFALQTKKNESKPIDFSKDELGEIGIILAQNYEQLKKIQQQYEQEKQKLLQHIQVLEEGICFISPDKNIQFYNGLFIQYLNTITDEPGSDAKIVLTDPAFEEVQQFINRNKASYYENVLHKQGKIFSVRINRFEDFSFEIILNDITKQEKTKRLKKEMTGNISHELRTPVTSIRGYLETVLNLSLEEEKKNYFIEKAFQQTLELSDLISDMSMLTKIEESPNLFTAEKVNVFEVIQNLKEENHQIIMQNNLRVNIEIPKTIEISGNRSLIYSIFRNLLENAIRYGGKNIQIGTRLFKEDNEFYYFTFYDTGSGIEEEKQLNRIFERFFRLKEGRTRASGGSGLGLSIVKNALQYHGGKITVKNRKNGGLEFLFSFKK